MGYTIDIHFKPAHRRGSCDSRPWATRDAFAETEHPRGQPENAGQFAEKGRGKATRPSSEPSSRPGSGGSRQTQTSPRSGVVTTTSAHLPAKRDTSGKLVSATGEAAPAHIASLRVPPAWTDVTYSPNPDAHLLVKGKDAAGRVQYVYSAAHSSKQAEAKFAKIRELENKYPAMQAQNAQAQQDPRTRTAADATALIMATGVRPGSETDTKAKVKAYGATTLEGQHVVQTPDGVRLQFVGKKGVAIDIPVADKAIAGMLLKRKQQAGETGQLFSGLDEKALLAYVHTLDGGSYRTKDFRTHLGTKTALDEIEKTKPPTNPTQYKKAVMDVAKAVSTKLGNTPTVALQSYIAPEVFLGWREAARVAA